MNYDLLIIGTEREGIERAISAARNGRLVAVIEVPDALPSMELLQQAADHVAESQPVSMSAWRAEVDRLSRFQTLADHAAMDRLGIERMSGEVRFTSETTVTISACGENRVISATEIVVACGTRSRQAASLKMDGRFVIGAESLLGMNDIPQTVVIVGAGATGMKSAILLAKLGVEVTVVDEHVSFLELCGLFDDSFSAVQSLNIAFRLGDEVIGSELRPEMQAAVRMANGRVLVADAILVCVGREGKTTSLNLEAAGVGTDERGRLWCNADGQTWSKRIVAVGDVIGFPQPNSVRRAVSVNPSIIPA